MVLQLGKKPAASHEPVTFKLTTFVDTSAKVFKVPSRFGHESLTPAPSLGMLGNDKFGDCVWAGAAHEHLILSNNAGKKVEFHEDQVLADYSAVTGFDPDTGANDNGTDMLEAAKYRQKVGIIDFNGKRHKIDAYLQIDPGNIKELYIAAYLFEAVGIGVEFPSSAMTQFNKGKPWSVVRGSSIEGGHYIPVVGKTTGPRIVTWGAYQQMTAGFFNKYNDETIAYVNLDALSSLSAVTLEGVDVAGLRSALAALTKG